MLMDPKIPKTASTQWFKRSYIDLILGGLGVLMFHKCHVNRMFHVGVISIKSISCNLENPELFVKRIFILHLKDTNLNSTNIVSVVL